MKTRFQGSTFRWSAKGSQAAGSVVSFVGVVVMFLWLIGDAEALRILPGYAKTVFNTGISLFLSGTALFFLKSRPKLAFGVASGLVIFSALTLIERYFGVDLKIDELFVACPPAADISHPGRMAAATAFCFFITGLSIIGFSQLNSFQFVRLGAGFLSTLVVKLGLVSCIGYLWGLRSAYTWFGQARMSITAAGCFVLIGLGLFAHFLETLPWMWSSRKRQLPVLVGISMVATSILFWHSFGRYDEEKIDIATSAQMNSFERQLTFSLENRILSLARMADRWGFGATIEKSEWQANASNRIADMPGIEAMLKLSPDGIVEWGVPEAHVKSLIGVDKNSDPDRKHTNDVARSTRSIQIGKVTKLQSGHLGFVAVSPVFHQDQFLGYIGMAFNLTSFIPSILETSGYRIEIKSEGRSIFSTADIKERASDRWLQSKPYDYRNIHWTIEITPALATVQRQTSFLPFIVLIIGLALSVLVTILLYLFCRAKEIENDSYRERQWNGAVIDGSDLMIVSTNTEGVIQTFNPAAERLLGYKANEVCDRHTPEDWFGEDELRAVIAELPAALRSQVQTIKDALFIGPRLNISHRHFQNLTDSNGGIHRVSLSTHCLRDSSGEISGYVIIGEDTTEMKAQEDRIAKQQAQIIAASKMSSLGEMAGGVAHELNTPLNTVLARGQLIELIATSPGPINHQTLQTHSEVIIHTVERMAQIIRGLKTFARDSSADPFIRCSIKQIVDDTLSMCAERFRSHGVVIKLDVDPYLSADCRASQISQILLNLLNNAFDAVLEKPLEQLEKWIEVSVSRTTTGVQMAVSNSGPAIPAEIREKIMQPFFTTKEVGKGTGLGLSISRGIAEAHGGWLIIDPLAPVAKFILWIPIEQKKLSLREVA